MQVVLGLLAGICFGFLLQKGGATDYGVIEDQLLLTDFNVLKLMLSAVIIGMIIFSFLKHFGYSNLHAAEGTTGSNVIGGLIFGAGLACSATARERWPVLSGRGRSTRSQAGWWGCSSGPVFSPISIRR